MGPNNFKPRSEEQQTSMLKPWRSKRRMLLVGIVAACLLIGGLVYRAKIANDQVAKNNKLASAEPKIIQTQPPRTDEFSITAKAADDLYAAGDIRGAIKKLEAYAPKVSDPSQVFAVSLRLGNYYVANRDSKNAIKWFEKALATGQPGADSLYLSIATEAEKAGDKPKAIASYRKLIELLKDKPGNVAKSNVEKYQAKIKSLGG